MKRKIILLWSLFIISLILLTIFWIKKFNSQNYVIANKNEYKVFSWQILEQKQQISNSWCLAWDQVYLWLAQNYKYNNEYELALLTLKNISECYPKAYNIKTEKWILLLNNIWDIYESWWYYLKEKLDTNYKIKYQKSLDSYNKILKLFWKTKFLSEDNKKEYKLKIDRIKEMMK